LYFVIPLLPDRTPSGSKDIKDGLTSFDMELPDARNAAQNQPFFRTLALYSTVHP